MIYIQQNNPYPDQMSAIEFLETCFEFVFVSSWIPIKAHASQTMNDLKNIKYHLDLMQARYSALHQSIN